MVFRTDGVDTAVAPGPKRSLKKRIAFALVAFLLALAVAEAGLRIFKAVHRREFVAAGLADDCDGIVFICLGDSMTYGLGASQLESYPMRLAPAFRRLYEGTPVNVYNLGSPGTNTAEGLIILRRFLTTNRAVKADYAFILYGVNNRWNLANAAFWEWDKDVKKENYFEYLSSRFQLGKMFKVAVESRFVQPSNEPSSKPDYRKMLDTHGWDMFFTSFNDELLARWIESDLVEMARVLRDRGIQPVFLSYHYPKFPELNSLLREIAEKAGVAFIDIEEPFEFYGRRKLLDEDNFHLNAKGYDNMARRIVRSFSGFHDVEDIRRHLAEKKAGDRCLRDSGAASTGGVKKTSKDRFKYR